MRNWVFILSVFLVLLSSCSAYKYVGPDEYLLKSVTVKTDISKEDLNNENPKNYLRQQPNSRILGIFPFSLHLYSLSSKRDSTGRKWINRFLRKVGKEPEIFSEDKMNQSITQLERFAANKGFMNASAEANVTYKRRTANVTYTLHGHQPYYLRHYSFRCQNDEIRKLVLSDTTRTLLKSGMLFDHAVLDSERDRITTFMRRNGYYKFGKEYMRFLADSTRSRNQVDVNLVIRSRARQDEETEDLSSQLRPYTVNKVYFYTSYDPIEGMSPKNLDSIDCKGYIIYFDSKLKLRPSVLVDNCHIEPQTLYNEQMVEKTYTSLNMLPIVNYVDIRFVERTDVPNTLDCVILLSPGKSQSYSVDLEGTNSNGDFGFAGILGYQHKNIFHGSEILKASVKYARETETGALSDLLKHRSNEFEGNLSLTFPRFLFPFLKSEFKRRIRASTEFSVGYNYQDRADFARQWATAGIKYNWTKRKFAQSFNLLDISYISLLRVTNAFREKYLKGNSILKYSFEDQVIVGWGYSFSLGKQPITKLKDNFTVRLTIETAGNLLNGIVHLVSKPSSDGHYKLFGIRYAQYVRGTIDFAYDKFLDKRQNLVFHVGLGAVCPYGNADIAPFEKRFISGGANSVRGWAVRSLGPGIYRGESVDYMNQSGDIKIDANIEYRFRLFWRLHGALFVDTGNIWTIRNYEGQEGGVFKINKFYKQLAVGYGLGIRLDFTYFLIRFDLGFKAYDPSRLYEGKEWRFKGFRWKDDKTFHFAIGYPF